MTILYRSAPSESPHFGRGSFWTMHPDSAEWLAEVEAGTPALAAHRLYRREVLIGDDVREQPVDDLLQPLREKPLQDALPRLRDALRNEGERHAAAGCMWVQFTDHSKSWHGAMLYLGDDPIRAARA
jgi:hypothetical protein